MSRQLVSLTVASMVVGSWVGAIGLGKEPAFHWEATPGESLALIGPNGIVWKFHFAADLPKPFIDPVSLISGESLTWNAPADHVWHHALWFSWKTINGVNYWEHDPSTGKPVGCTSWAIPVITTDEVGAARIELDLWYAPENSPPVLRETRHIDITAPDSDGRYDLDWESVFVAAEHDVVLDRTPIPPHPEGKSWGGYAGLSLRLAKDLTERRVVTDRGESAFDQAGIHRSRAAACDYQGTINGQHAGIAMLSFPNNPRHPTPWYAIRSKMSYLNAAFLEAEPYTIMAGESLRLRYRIIVHSGFWNSQNLATEASAWHEKR